jgi:hypothetical protein
MQQASSEGTLRRLREARGLAGVILDAHALVDEPFGGAGLGLTASASAELEALVRPLRGAYCSQGERVA